MSSEVTPRPGRSPLGKDERALNALVVGPGRSINPYCVDLAAALADRPEIRRLVYGLVQFWHGYRPLDIVHLHFPEILTGYREPKAGRVSQVLERLRWWQRRGARLVVTAHDRLPHGRHTVGFGALYEAIHNCADAVVHLGETSRREMVQVPGVDPTRHVVAPHHLFADFTDAADRFDARRRLKLPLDHQIVVVAQTLRSTAEVDMIAAVGSKPRRTMVIAGRTQAFDHRTADAVRRRRRMLAEREDIVHHDGYVQPGRLRLLISAADVVLVAREDTWNSGGVALGTGLSRVVVGPGRGNVGEQLVELGNPTFDPKLRQSIVDAVDAGLLLATGDHAVRARTHAAAFWGPDIVGSRHVAIYHTVVARRSGHIG